MIKFDYIWLYIDWIWLNMIKFDYMWWYIVFFYDYIWLYMIKHVHKWLDMIIYDYMWLNMIIYDYIYIYYKIFIYMMIYIYTHYNICIIINDDIYIYICVYDYICIWLYIYIIIYAYTLTCTVSQDRSNIFLSSFWAVQVIQQGFDSTKRDICLVHHVVSWWFLRTRIEFAKFDQKLHDFARKYLTDLDLLEVNSFVLHSREQTCLGLPFQVSTNMSTLYRRFPGECIATFFGTIDPKTANMSQFLQLGPLDFDPDLGYVRYFWGDRFSQ